MTSSRPEEEGAADLPFEGEEPTHSEDGVDLTLIRWMLSLTPAERLQMLQQTVQAIQRIRDANSETWPVKDSGSSRQEESTHEDQSDHPSG